MMDFLKKIQNQPEHIRKIILWAIVIIVALILGSWWIYSSYWKIKKFPKEEFINPVKKEFFNGVKELELPQFKEIK